MVTFKICTFVYLNVDYHHQEHFFGREWNDSQFQNIRGGVKVLKFWIVCPLKTLIFGRSKHLKNSSKTRKHRLRLASDSQKRICRIFFHTKIPGSLPIPITVFELWEWLFPFHSHNSLRERTPLVFKISNSSKISRLPAKNWDHSIMFYKHFCKGKSAVEKVMFNVP
jgi:hypothetical protein